jgi:hypothetical protein
MPTKRGGYDRHLETSLPIQLLKTYPYLKIHRAHDLMMGNVFAQLGLGLGLVEISINRTTTSTSFFYKNGLRSTTE